VTGGHSGASVCALDVAARDVAAERVPTFASKNNLLSRFSKLIFSIF
jgi:hypothetical protein